MGAGIHGGFGRTRGAVAGDAVYRSDPQKYFEFIKKRSDIDKDGMYDVVAHGKSNTIQIEHNGEVLEIDSRIASKLISRKSDYKKGQPLRLLSCETGASDFGFAQNLANKLNVIVEAPTKLVWARSDGTYFVASRMADNPNKPNFSDLGMFKRFYPGGKKK